MVVLGGEEGTHPSKVRLFKNRPNMSFSDAEGPADQEFNLGNNINLEIIKDYREQYFSRKYLGRMTIGNSMYLRII